jgi:indolepyruvate ferredoxin oxidoreductase alpha subunit
MRRAGEKIPTYTIYQDKCKKCKTCIGRFGCPAIYYADDESIQIDETQCNSCGNCVDVCPFDAISKKEVDI